MGNVLGLWILFIKKYMNLLTLKFWFSFSPGPLLPNFHAILVGFIILLIAYIFLANILFKKKKGLHIEIINRITTFAWVNAFLGFVFVFFNYELVPFLSSRFWYLVWAISMLTWMFNILKHVKKIPERKKKMEKHKEYNKYIPR